MNCPQCNRVLREGALFCDGCGSSADVARSQQASAAASSDFPETKAEIDPLAGKIIGAKYQLLSLLGAGGMGSVYRARRLHIGDDVAVKILHREYVDEEKTVERFRREAQAAAMIRHPAVVAIYDFSEARDKEPAYIVMELVEGRSLRKILESEGSLGPQRAVAIMREICKGVGAAHRLHVVHRDIKPENIMVLPPDSEDHNESVKVVDFGIAKLRDMAADKKLTQTGRVVGTVYYMSPEQCCAEHLDARSDVYSLGAVMYEMLAGAPPFTAETGTAIVAKHLTETPAPLPEQAGVPAQLETAVLRSLSKEPQTRQSDATALRRELEAAIGVLETPTSRQSTLEEKTRTTSNQPGKDSAVVSSENSVSNSSAVISADTATRRPNFLRWILVGIAATLLVVAAFIFTRRAAIEKPLAEGPSQTPVASNSWQEKTTLQTDRKVYAIAFSPDDQLVAGASSEGLRQYGESISEIKLWSRQTGELRKTLTEHSEGALSVAFSPNGNVLAVATGSGTDASKIGKVKLWDVQTGSLKWAVNGHKDLATSVAFSPDGEMIASGSLDHVVKLWDAQTGEWRQSFSQNESVYAIAFSPDGKLLATASQKSVELWDLESSQVKRSLPAEAYAVRAIAFSRDGQSIATGDVKGSVKLWNVQDGSLKQTFNEHSHVVAAVTFSPDGKILASGSYDNTVIFWNLQTMTRLTTQQAADRVTSVAFSHDGRTFATGGWDKTVRLLDVNMMLGTPMQR
jgi:serine/threonine protein kinase